MANSKHNKKSEKGIVMHEEIFSQPEVAELILGVYFQIGSDKLSLPLLGKWEKKAAQVEEVVFLGCGTSYHAGLYGQYLFEDIVGLPARVEYADEFAKREVRLSKKTLVVGLSQSGETGDVKKAIRRAGALTLALVNKRGSSLEKMSEAALYLEAGEEKALAATKSYLAELMVIYLLALRLVELRTGKIAPLRLRKAIKELPEGLRGALRTETQIKRLAKQLAKHVHFPVIGERYGYPAALEGVLKAQETSYLAAHGFPTGEYRHGPLAMLGKKDPALFLSSENDKWETTDEVVEAVKKAGAKAIVITDRASLKDLSADRMIHIPHIHETLFTPIAAIPLQLLAFHLAAERGVDTDKPRHLNKYVA
jgi:glucosamine--fructose-6-phosphate aminotransferase (isomerizing)